MHCNQLSSSGYFADIQKMERCDLEHRQEGLSCNIFPSMLAYRDRFEYDAVLGFLEASSLEELLEPLRRP
jgi:hypothetical protein